MTQDLARAGVVALFGMLVSLLPLGVAFAYMLRPRERLLALMRPLSLATIFAALNTILSGVAAVLRHIPSSPLPADYDVRRITLGLSESVTPMFVAFGFLAVAWLFIAVGMRRTA
jgi:hypothetical protein